MQSVAMLQRRVNLLAASLHTYPCVARNSIAWAARKKTDMDVTAEAADTPKRKPGRKKKDAIELVEVTVLLACRFND